MLNESCDLDRLLENTTPMSLVHAARLGWTSFSATGTIAGLWDDCGSPRGMSTATGMLSGRERDHATMAAASEAARPSGNNHDPTALADAGGSEGRARPLAPNASILGRGCVVFCGGSADCERSFGRWFRINRGLRLGRRPRWLAGRGWAARAAGGRSIVWLGIHQHRRQRRGTGQQNQDQFTGVAGASHLTLRSGGPSRRTATVVSPGPVGLVRAGIVVIVARLRWQVVGDAPAAPGDRLPGRG